MSEDILFGVAAILVLACCALLHHTFVRLAYWHPEIYEQLGRPRVFGTSHTTLKGLVRSSLAGQKFVITRAHVPLNDATLSRLSDGALLALAANLFLGFVHMLQP